MSGELSGPTRAGLARLRMQQEEAQWGKLLRSCCCASGECMCMDCLKGDHATCAKRHDPEPPELGASIADRLTYLEWRMNRVEHER